MVNLNGFFRSVLLHLTVIHRSYSDSKAASWRRGSTSDLVNAALLSDGGTQFTQSLCIPRDSYGAGQSEMVCVCVCAASCMRADVSVIVFHLLDILNCYVHA